MSSDHAKPGSTPKDRSGKGGWIVLGSIVAVLVIIALIGTVNRALDENRLDAQASRSVDVASTASDPISTEMPLPDGPNIDAFQNSCLTCHSARLPLGQPPFGREKWSEIVHKMSSVYGAPMTPEVESKVVDYIVKVRPPES